MPSRSGLATGHASNSSATMRRGLYRSTAGGQDGDPLPHWAQDASLATANASGISRAARSRTAVTARSYGLPLVVMLAVAVGGPRGFSGSGASRMKGSP